LLTSEQLVGALSGIPQAEVLDELDLYLAKLMMFNRIAHLLLLDKYDTYS
jgi:hypothetical protein